MKASVRNALVDTVALISGTALAVTGLVLRYVLPHGSGSLMAQGMGWRAQERPVTLLWGMTRHEWGEIHFYCALALLGILALHVGLHWRWVLGMVGGKPGNSHSGRRLALGALALLLLAALAASPFLFETEQMTRGELLEIRALP